MLDGGLATQLEARGLSLDDPLWSARALVDAPEAVAAVHRDYLEAGADIIETATYQATIPGLRARGMSDEEAAGVLLEAVALAMRSRSAYWKERAASDARPRPLVAASIGPYGAFLADGSEYRGDYGLAAGALADWHRSRVRLLEGSGADLLAFETVPSVVEVDAIVRLLAEDEGPPAWISFQTRDTKLLADGTPVETAARLADGCSRVFAIGVNCVAPEAVTGLLARLRAVSAKPLVAYPNRGGAWDPRSRSWGPGASDVPLDRLAREWRDSGACLIGGCCRTTPADIRAIAAAL